jgi:hypothetical protein
MTHQAAHLTPRRVLWTFVWQKGNGDVRLRQLRAPRLQVPRLRLPRPGRGWLHALYAVLAFLVVMAIIGAIVGPQKHSATPAPRSPASASAADLAPPAATLTSGAGELQATDAHVAQLLAHLYPTADVYLVPRLPWTLTVGAHIAWTFPAGCTHNDHLACTAVGVEYDQASPGLATTAATR